MRSFCAEEREFTTHPTGTPVPGPTCVTLFPCLNDLPPKHLPPRSSVLATVTSACRSVYSFARNSRKNSPAKQTQAASRSRTTSNCSSTECVTQRGENSPYCSYNRKCKLLTNWLNSTSSSANNTQLTQHPKRPHKQNRPGRSIRGGLSHVSEESRPSSPTTAQAFAGHTIQRLLERCITMLPEHAPVHTYFLGGGA